MPSVPLAGGRGQPRSSGALLCGLGPLDEEGRHHPLRPDPEDGHLLRRHHAMLSLRRGRRAQRELLLLVQE